MFRTVYLSPPFRSSKSCRNSCNAQRHCAAFSQLLMAALKLITSAEVGGIACCSAMAGSRVTHPCHNVSTFLPNQPEIAEVHNHQRSPQEINSSKSMVGRFHLQEQANKPPSNLTIPPGPGKGAKKH